MCKYLPRASVTVEILVALGGYLRPATDARTRASRACHNSVLRLVRIENEPIVDRSVACNSCFQAAQKRHGNSLDAAISSLACE
jgi:hypothetical protein